MSKAIVSGDDYDSVPADEQYDTAPANHEEEAIAPVSHHMQAGRRRWSNRHTTTRYNPVMAAVISGNTMNNCAEVAEMYAECRASGSKDTICKVAAQYMELCMKGHAIPAYVVHHE